MTRKSFWPRRMTLKQLVIICLLPLVLLTSWSSLRKWWRGDVTQILIYDPTLTSIQVPDGARIFRGRGLDALTTLTLPQGLEEVECFDCPKLTQVEFPASIKRVTFVRSGLTGTLVLRQGTEYVQLKDNPKLTVLIVPAGGVKELHCPSGLKILTVLGSAKKK